MEIGKKLFENKEINLKERKLKEAKGKGLKPGEYIKVDSILKMWTEDDYNQGEIGRSSDTILDAPTKKFESFEELQQKLISYYGLSDKDNAWGVFGGEDGRIEVSQLEDNDGYEASESQIADWKVGDETLYSAMYSIYVTIVSEEREPSSEELLEITGLQEI